VRAESRLVPGLVRERSLRTTQEGRLLREATRIEVTAAFLLLLALGAWRLAGGPGGRARRPPATAVLLAALLPSLLLAGCAPEGAPEPTVAELRVLELLALRESGDVAVAADLFHPLAVWEDHPGQRQLQGLPEIAAFLEEFHGWASGIFLDVLRVHPAGDRAVAEWVLEGVQSAPYPGVADSATFRRFLLEGVTVVEVERGLIVRVAEYADMLPLLLDLGGSATLPNGDVISAPEPPAP
ncbi:MAG: nuclear transport factor 2 family protein, partial [Longimicrobiales bacterium]|nr:nuclear transport factor 2 family protein [Longimicrobiales bacterium]